MRTKEENLCNDSDCKIHFNITGCLNTLTDESGCANASIRAKQGRAGISFIWKPPSETEFRSAKNNNHCGVI